MDESDRPKQSGTQRQLSMAQLLIILLLVAVWFSAYQLVEQVAMLAFVGLLCIVTTLLCRHRRGRKTAWWKVSLAVGSWCLLYFLSAGPIIGYSKDVVDDRILTTAFPFVKAHVVSPNTRIERTVYRLRGGLSNSALRRYFHPWWN